MGKKKNLTIFGRLLFVLISLLASSTVIAYSTIHSDVLSHDSSFNYQLATHQGPRKYQEDRMLCAHDLHTLGDGFTNINISIAAIFDGHNGVEASEMASKVFVNYFSQHVDNLLTSMYSASANNSTTKSLGHGKTNVLDYKRWLLASSSPSIYMNIFKESLLRTIYDIDTSFSNEAFKKNLKSGSTATIVLKVHNHILVAYVGDSKAILCSKSKFLPLDVKGYSANLNRRRRHKLITSAKNDEKHDLKTLDGAKCFLVNELTKDHHPDDVCERNRVESVGGYIEEWASVSRVNGILAVSRSIGDVYLKRYGVISIPDVTDWQRITTDNAYLVVGSDGVFEKLTTQEVCNLLWDANLQSNPESSSLKNSLADYIVKVALENGTTDNISVIVISL